MSIIKDLKSSGERITRARTELIKILEESNLPISAKDFVDKLSVNKTTVYRELAFLKEKGLIKEIQLGDGQKRYELATNDHHHLICLSCEKIEDVEVKENLAAQQRAISLKNKFKVMDHSLEFFGYCRSCQ